MKKINMNNVYQNRIMQIEIDKKKAIINKRWAEVAKLEAEKTRVEKLINETQ